MIRNSLIALAAVAALGAAMASSAEAKTQVNFDIGINLGAAGLYLGPGYYDDGYITVEDDCRWQLVKHRKWNASRTRKIVFFTKEHVCD